MCEADGSCTHTVIEGCWSCGGRCGEPVNPEAACACDGQCTIFGDCCEDYAPLCEPCETDQECNDGLACTEDLCFYDEGCQHFVTDECLGIDPEPLVGSCEARCYDAYDEEQSCQCDDLCDQGEDCCADFGAACSGSCVGICGLYHGAATCQCDPECVDYDDCCGDYSFNCESIECEEDTACDDQNPCTSDLCVDGLCTFDTILGCEEGTGGGGPEGSCEGSCGQYLPGAECQCDPQCAQFADCCGDFAELCPGCEVDDDCTASGECKQAACVEGLCEETPVAGCLVVQLPYEEPFDCGGETALAWEAEAPEGVTPWAVDGVPEEPYPLTGICRLNAADAAGFKCVEPPAVSTARSPWIDGTTVTAEQQVGVFFALAGGWAQTSELALTVEREDGEQIPLGMVPATPASAEEPWALFGVQAAPASGLHVAGHKFRLRLDFTSGVCGEAAQAGPFIDDLLVLAADCKDEDPCTDSMIDPYTAGCVHLKKPECCTATCGDGACGCDEKTTCPEDCAACTEGVCCDVAAGVALPLGTKCGDTLLFVEDKCLNGAVIRQKAVPGCAGDGATCSEDPGHWAWSEWVTVDDCKAKGLDCVQTSPTSATCYDTTPVAEPCPATDLCCEGATGLWKPEGSFCSSLVLETFTKCEGGKLHKSSRRKGCDSATGDCSEAFPNWTEWLVIDCPAGCQYAASGVAECAGEQPACEGGCCDELLLFKGAGAVCSQNVLAQEWQCVESEVQVRAQHPACEADGSCGTAGATAWTDWSTVETCEEGETCTVAAAAGGKATCVADTPAVTCSGPCCDGASPKPAGTQCGVAVDTTLVCNVGNEVVERQHFGTCTGSDGACATAASALVVVDTVKQDCPAAGQTCLQGKCVDANTVERNLVVTTVDLTNGVPWGLFPPVTQLAGSAQVCNKGVLDIDDSFKVIIAVGTGSLLAAFKLHENAEKKGEKTFAGLPAGKCQPVPFDFQIVTVASQWGDWQLWVVADPVTENAHKFGIASPGTVVEAFEVEDNINSVPFVVGQCKIGTCCDPFKVAFVGQGTKCGGKVETQYQCKGAPHEREKRVMYQACTGANPDCISSPAHLVGSDWKKADCKKAETCEAVPGKSDAKCVGQAGLKVLDLDGPKGCVAMGSKIKVRGTTKNVGKAAAKPFLGHFYWSQSGAKTPVAGAPAKTFAHKGLAPKEKEETPWGKLSVPTGVTPGTKWFLVYEADREQKNGPSDAETRPLKLSQCCDGECCKNSKFRTTKYTCDKKVKGPASGFWNACHNKDKYVKRSHIMRRCSGTSGDCPKDKFKGTITADYKLVEVDTKLCWPAGYCLEGKKPGTAKCKDKACNTKSACCDEPGVAVKKGTVCMERTVGKCKKGKALTWTEVRKCNNKGLCDKKWQKKGSTNNKSLDGACVEEEVTEKAKNKEPTSGAKPGDENPPLEKDSWTITLPKSAPHKLGFAVCEMAGQNETSITGKKGYATFMKISASLKNQGKGASKVNVTVEADCSPKYGGSINAKIKKKNTKAKKYLKGKVVKPGAWHKGTGMDFQVAVGQPAKCTLSFQASVAGKKIGAPCVVKNIEVNGCTAGLCCNVKSWTAQKKDTHSVLLGSNKCQWITCDGKSPFPSKKVSYACVDENPEFKTKGKGVYPR